MASNQEFYFVTNVVATIADYEKLNSTLQQMYVNVRFGPPLDSEKRYQVGLLAQGFVGIYAKKENFVLPLRDLVGDPSVTLEDAVNMGFKALSEK